MTVEASTLSRIEAYFRSQPTSENGWIKYSPSELQKAIPDKKAGNLSVQLVKLTRNGTIEVLKNGRYITHVRLDRSHSVEQIKQSGSQTERMFHYLFSLSNEKGEIPNGAVDIRDLQRTLNFRDYHDVNKALHNLNKLGMLAFKQQRIGNGGDHRLTDLRIRLERKDLWPVDMLTDEELPGKDEVESTDIVELGEEEMQDLAEITTGSEVMSKAEPITFPEEIGAPQLFNPERYPNIAKAVSQHRARTKALILLRQAGEDEIGDLLAEKHGEPIIQELANLLVELGYYGKDE